MQLVEHNQTQPVASNGENSLNTIQAQQMIATSVVFSEVVGFHQGFIFPTTF
jgi:hypothetical protein